MLQLLNIRPKADVKKVDLLTREIAVWKTNTQTIVMHSWDNKCALQKAASMNKHLNRQSQNIRRMSLPKKWLLLAFKHLCSCCHADNHQKNRSLSNIDKDWTPLRTALQKLTEQFIWIIFIDNVQFYSLTFIMMTTKATVEIVGKYRMQQLQFADYCPTVCALSFLDSVWCRITWYRLVFHDFFYAWQQLHLKRRLCCGRFILCRTSDKRKWNRRRYDSVLRPVSPV